MLEEQNDKTLGNLEATIDRTAKTYSNIRTLAIALAAAVGAIFAAGIYFGKSMSKPDVQLGVTAAYVGAYVSNRWTGPVSETEVQDFINGCHPTAMSDFFGMLSQADSGHWNLYVFCKKEHSSGDQIALRVTVVAQTWPGGSIGATPDQNFAKKSLDGREAVVLGIANGNNVFVAYRDASNR
jgi:hypothetical protein